MSKIEKIGNTVKSVANNTKASHILFVVMFYLLIDQSLLDDTLIKNLTDDAIKYQVFATAWTHKLIISLAIIFRDPIERLATTIITSLASKKNISKLVDTASNVVEKKLGK